MSEPPFWEAFWLCEKIVLNKFGWSVRLYIFVGEITFMMKAAKKKAKPSVGKNIRVSEDAWEKIRDYCAYKGLVMGAFVENSALNKIPASFIASYYPIQETKQ